MWSELVETLNLAKSVQRLYTRLTIGQCQVATTLVSASSTGQQLPGDIL